MRSVVDMPAQFHIRQDDLTDQRTLDLIGLHLLGMHASSPPGTVFALEATALKASDVTVWTAWSDDAIAGIAALKQLSQRHGEVKSMRTHPAFVRRGVASALLEHLIQEARARGLTQLSLETGKGATFDAALTLYRRRGFLEGAPFADYRPNGHSVFLHLTL
jgi:putative acetyltransferase